MSLVTRSDELNQDPYALLTLAEYHQWNTRNQTKAMQLYVNLFRGGDPQVSDDQPRTSERLPPFSYRVYTI